MTTAPKVFISHASEDKERFARPFAAELRHNGVDAWFDAWEMRPGDNLVEKISGGLKEAEGFVIVLSKNSVGKPWVREELNTAIVKRIAAPYRIIPVVLDDCEIPELLLSTLYVRVNDLNDIKQPARQVIDAIFGLSDKPPLGPPPTSPLGTAPASPAPAREQPPRHPTYRYLDAATLRELIGKQEANLAISLKQAKSYGEADLSLRLVNQIESIVSDLRALQQELELRG